MFICTSVHTFLTAGRCTGNKDSEIISDEIIDDPQESSKPSIPCSRESISGSFDSEELNGKIGGISGDSIQGSAGAFICDVDSVAWGLCGDTFDEREESSFEELLFVSGKQGVVVHAFSQFCRYSGVIKPEQANDAGEGKWVEWGPSTNLSPTFGVREEEESHHKTSQERTKTFHAEAAAEDGRSANTRIWMETFLTKVERVTSGSHNYTRFPRRPLFPNSVVVSFRILDQESHFLDLLSPGGTASCGQTNPSVNKTDVHLNSSIKAVAVDNVNNLKSGDKSSSYKCTKVFSSNSYRLVGFALVDISSKPVDINDGNCVKVLVSVARTVSWGIQWLYSVKVGEKLDAGPFEWIDFSFSDRFLICLSTSGTISLYGTMTGEYVASLNVSRMNGLGHSSRSQHHIGSRAVKRKFKRLFVFPHSLLLGVMDESGIIHAVPTNNHVHEDHFSFEDVLPYQYYSDHGFLTSWEVGGAEIGYQRILSNTSAAWGNTRLAAHGRNSCFIGKGNLEHINVKDSKRHNGSYPMSFSSVAQTSNEKKLRNPDSLSCLTRKAFIPLQGCGENDVICCSHFGVTRLIHRSSSEKKLCQVVHANLQLDCAVNDDSDFVIPAGETSPSEAVGCNFSGCLYLVTSRGLSVVLPSISAPPNFFPVEAIGYCLPDSSSSIKYGAGDLMGGRTTKPLSPWKVEVLDRALLYEHPEVAEKLCLENGKTLLFSTLALFLSFYFL